MENIENKTYTSTELRKFKDLNPDKKWAMLDPYLRVIPDGWEHLTNKLKRQGVDGQPRKDVIQNIIGLQNRDPRIIEMLLNEHAKLNIQGDSDHMKETLQNLQRLGYVMDCAEGAYSKYSGMDLEQVIRSEYGLAGNKPSLLGVVNPVWIYSTKPKLEYGKEGYGKQFLGRYGYDSEQLIGIFNESVHAFKGMDFEKFGKEEFNTALDFEKEWSDFDKILGINETTELRRDTGAVEIHVGSRELWELAEYKYDQKHPMGRVYRAQAQLAHEHAPHQKHHFNLGQGDKRSIIQAIVAIAHAMASEKMNEQGFLKKEHGFCPQMEKVAYNTADQIMKA